MQVTADSTETPVSGTNAEETRPVRLLVPTLRRSDQFMSADDASNADQLGITRRTTEDELDALTTAASEIAEYANEPIRHLRRLRDALRHPRDIAEAREWGYLVPEDENREELSPDPRKRLGWWWVYDPERAETRAERRVRYRGDERLIDTKGFARVVCRAYITTKDLKFESDGIRKAIADANHRRKLALEWLAHEQIQRDKDEVAQLAHDQLAQRPDATLEEITAELRSERPAPLLEDLVGELAAKASAATIEKVMDELLAKANKDVLKAMPERRERAGQSDLWFVRDAIDNGRAMSRLNEWYERNTIKQVGRPRGAKTRNRRPRQIAPDASQTSGS